MRKDPKKTSTIEIRLPHAIKQAFQERCRSDGATISERLRSFIEDYLAAAPAPIPHQEPSMPHLTTPRRAAALIALGFGLTLGLVVFAAPGLARPDLRAVFESMDLDHDGAVTLDEFRSAGGDVLFFAGPSAGDVDHNNPADPGFAAPVTMPFNADAAPPQGVPVAPDILASLRQHEFGLLDLDASASVTFPEFASHHMTIMRASFVALDKNGDNRIEAGEFRSAPLNLAGTSESSAASMLGALDVNHDGAADWDEFLNGT